MRFYFHFSAASEVYDIIGLCLLRDYTCSQKHSYSISVSIATQWQCYMDHHAYGQCHDGHATMEKILHYNCFVVTHFTPSSLFIGKCHQNHSPFTFHYNIFAKNVTRILSCIIEVFQPRRAHGLFIMLQGVSQRRKSRRGMGPMTITSIQRYFDISRRQWSAFSIGLLFATRLTIIWRA